MTAAVPNVKDLNTLDLDKLLENVAPLGRGKALQNNNATKKTQDAKEEEKRHHNGFEARPAKYVAKQNKHNTTERYVGRGFPAGSSSSPGPIYQAASCFDKTKSSTFSKAPRLKDKNMRNTPGPKYEITSTLGSQLTRSSSPVCKIGMADRFANKQYLSASHAKTGNVSAENGVGPAAYQSMGEGTQTGPAYSFGASDSSKPRFNEKVYISSGHAKTSGFGTHGPGPQPALTKHTLYGCSAEMTSKCKKSPQYRFAANNFEAEVVRKPSPSKLVKDSPGPGVYDPNVEQVRTKAPSYSFGVQSDTSKLFVSSSLSVAKGRESPGPNYSPEMWAVQVAAPSYSFADPDPETSQWKSRFTNNRYIGAGIGMFSGTASPGPAVYDAPNLPRGPAYSMAKRDKMLMKRICPAPDRSRFISKELAKENLGCYSPGPKYALPGTIGGSNSIGFTFGTTDREFEDYDADTKGKLGSIDKPYTSPAEARFISKEHASMNKGKYGPGPKYLPEGTVTRMFEADGTVTSYTNSIESRHHTAPAITMGSRPKAKHTVDSRSYHPDDRTIKRASPGYGFGSASRCGVGPVTQVEAAGQKRGMDSNDKHRNIESSPGPGAFKPNHSSVETHKPGVSLGGLSAGYSMVTTERPPRRTGSPAKANDMDDHLSSLGDFGMDWDAAEGFADIDRSLVLPSRQGDSTVMIAELNNRLRVRMREVHALKNALQRYGADDKQLSLYTTTHLTALGAKDAKIRNLETRLKTLERQLEEKDAAIMLGRSELAELEDEAFYAPERHDISTVINSHVMQLKDDLLRQQGAQSERSKQQSEEVQKLVKRSLKLQLRLKDSKQKREAKFQTFEKQYMQQQDYLHSLEAHCAALTDSVRHYQMKENRQQGERTNHSATLFDEVKERFILEFGPTAKMETTNDKYIKQLLEKSYFKEGLMTLKEELREWVLQTSNRQEQCIKTLWTLIDKPNSSRQPRKDAYKSITETQRKHKLSVADMGRKVNQALKGLMERERSLSKELITKHETAKIETNVSEGCMCVIPDPPPPIVSSLKTSLKMAHNDKQLLSEAKGVLQKERDGLEDDVDALLSQTHELHYTLYNTLKTVWTHRYRFTETMEDPVRELLAKKSRKHQTPESLRRVFNTNTEKILSRDREMLEIFKEYITSDELYKRDMMALARQKREEEARKRNMEAGYALHVKKDEERKAPSQPSAKKRDQSRSPRVRSCFDSEKVLDLRVDTDMATEILPFHLPKAAHEHEDLSLHSASPLSRESKGTPRTPRTPHTPRTLHTSRTTSLSSSPPHPTIVPTPVVLEYPSTRTPSAGSPVSSLRSNYKKFGFTQSIAVPSVSYSRQHGS